MSEWLSPNDAPPGDGQSVLYVIKTDGEVISGKYLCGYFLDNAGAGQSAEAKDVACWMPSPEVPYWAKEVF